MIKYDELDDAQRVFFSKTIYQWLEKHDILEIPLSGVEAKELSIEMYRLMTEKWDEAKKKKEEEA